MMEYLIANAQEIMMLLIGAGFGILCIVASRALWIATALLRKINAITDLTVEYINKPLNMIVQTEKTVSKLLKQLNR